MTNYKDNTLTPMMERAGIPEEDREDFIDSVGSFTTAMSILLQANEEVAPNFITIAMYTPAGDGYELTVRHVDGKTPCERIDDLETENERLRDQNNQLSNEMLVTDHLRKENERLAARVAELEEEALDYRMEESNRAYEDLMRKD